MLTYNFHTHTMRCRHASGEDREYVESAIKGGIKTLGFSDHAPYVFKDGYYSTFRMRPNELEGYVKSVLDLKEEYKNEIDIHLGLEAEYYPEFFSAFLDLLKPYPIEYLILGQHATQNEMDSGYFTAAKTKDEGMLNTYVHQVVSAIKTGKFSYIAHPDVLHFRENEQIEENAWRTICQCAKDMNVPLEINLLGLRDKRHYPYKTFWKIAGETQSPVTIGSDAHNPWDICDNVSFETAKLMIKKYNLNYMGMPKLICPNGSENA